MPPQDDKSYIEELKKSLYSRTAPDVRTKRKLRFTPPENDVKTDWEHPKEEDIRPKDLNTEYKDHHMSFFTKLLIVSVIFCIAAVGVGAYLFFNGSNLISANNITIAIDGPVSIAGGTPVSFDVTVVNKNNVDLQLADMSVDFPAGVTDPSSPGTPLTHTDIMIGDLPAGGSSHQTVSAIIFGEANLQKEIKVTLTYNVKGSSVSFTKTQTYDVLINSSPISVTATSYKETTSGQEFDIRLDLKSNSQQVLKNILLKATYPFGYTFISSSMPTSGDNTTWKVGDLPPGADKVVIVHGKLVGENSDLRAFHFTVGAFDASDPRSIATEYTTIEQDLTIQKPFISTDISIDNDTGAADHVGQFDQPEHVEIYWTNNLPVNVSNLTITAKLSGTAYDKNSVQPESGTFDSINNQIIWNQQTNPEMGSVSAGDSGRISFSITPRDLGVSGHPIINPTLTFNIGVTGNRAQEANVPSAISSVAVKNVRVSTNIAFSGRIVRTVGPFANSGPIPPKAEQVSTYTVIWDVDNTSNLVDKTRVTATLPPYVKWLNVVSPSTENVTYDKNSGQIVWDVGNVGTYTLNSSRRREVNFQISFTPNVTQINQTPILLNQTNLTAMDDFTGASIGSQQDSLTTRFSTDPTYQEGNEMVSR